MEFLVWDKLQLSNLRNNGFIVHKQSVSFDFYRTFKKKVSWTPLSFRNGALFHNDNEFEVKTFVETMASQSRKFDGSVVIPVYDLTGRYGDFLSELESRFKAVEFHPYHESFSSIVNEFSDYRDVVATEDFRSRVVEDNRRKILLPVIITDSAVESDFDFAGFDGELFGSFVSSSEFQRIFPFFLMSDASVVPDSVMIEFDWCAFIGEGNVMYCRHELHPEMEDSYYSVRQVITGVVYSRANSRIITIHPYKFTPSEYHLKREKQLVDEDELYRRFLDSLDDGSSFV